jgi:mRNA interferase RelE/StbE
LAWTVEYTGTASRQLRKLDTSVSRRIVDYLSSHVAADPRASGKVLSGPLGAFWRYRVGDYRIICDIQDSRLRVLVLSLGNRKEIYR